MQKKQLSSDTEEYVRLISIDEGSREMKHAPSLEETDGINE